jgi:hypothetical protein
VGSLGKASHPTSRSGFYGHLAPAVLKRGSGQASVGYDVYDDYDLNVQKGLGELTMSHLVSLLEFNLIEKSGQKKIDSTFNWHRHSRIQTSSALHSNLRLSSTKEKNFSKG